MIKAAFFDIDGTLADMETHQPSPSVRQALAGLKAGGIRIFVSTGRHMQDIVAGHMLDGIAFDGYILLNGQFCVAGETVVHKHPINPSDIRGLVELLERNPFPCAFLEADLVFINYIDDYVRTEQEKTSGRVPVVMEAARALSRDIYQVIPYTGQEREAEILKSMPHCRITRWSDIVSDVCPADGGKSRGMERMMEFFGISREESIAFGDGRNDIDMLLTAGTGVAMGNAPEAVKAAADYVTGDIKQEGVCTALRHFGLIG